ncbi:IS110 family transposase [Rhodococcus sp. BP-252]|uniref:IS110 family transposase n=2 Tax=Rhodococcus TaxID=1827 RepID=UPI001C9B6483|nr:MULTISPECIES: IS110 family transposase [unclassified Rhodococcus (in: high G+C Gram-positive bacteria)]MBY6413896.1 IS110 family transposase [Rhodococcus sp. BP-320]MBY6418654.1 IS110 family transposase [Rhodococcus sp. BP-321]MBY6422949.1 IS110 family transposase [Rhodococcus sp. BP-324]MBY6428702.1 IS110 family transposase [Rhodococcus sp. BP-323]MBY6433775.1 IS110 family transposase [Rhodococcus sp. BP-322]
MTTPTHDQIEVFLGVDVGKGHHHAVALSRSGTTLFDRTLPNDEARIRELINTLTQHGPTILVVDQPATIGALAVAVAQDMDITVGYLPGLAMRRIADLYPGESKTDKKDAAIIADAARTLPHAIRTLKITDTQVAELSILSGFDDDLAMQITATSNRLHGLLTQIHPALERAIGRHIAHPAVLDLLAPYPTPDRIRRLGHSRLATRLSRNAPRMGTRLADEITTALAEQNVVIVGTSAAETVIPKLAEQLSALQRQRSEVATEVEALVQAHPLHPVLTSMPGVGIRTEARIITETSGKQFATAGHLAAYAGLAPVTRRSGSSIRGEHRSRRGNKKLKRVLYLSAFAALQDPLSREYYERKRAQGKSYNQALVALARRRCDVLFAMLRDGTTYNAGTPTAA